MCVIFSVCGVQLSSVAATVWIGFGRLGSEVIARRHTTRRERKSATSKLQTLTQDMGPGTKTGIIFANAIFPNF